MRKRIATQTSFPNRSESIDSWLDLEHIATVEVTSEDPAFPIESVFSATQTSGWRALDKKEQKIGIIFDQPTSIRRIYLRFIEAEIERLQEFTIKWAAEEGTPMKEVLRQQWNFSPGGSTSEVEDYEVHLDRVSVLELAIKPDLGRDKAPATLAELRLA